MREIKSTIWGVFLIVLGGLLLWERLGNVDIPSGTLWPLILFVIATTKLVERRYGAAVMFVALGGVFLACTLHLYGMSYERSWPLFMVAVGLGMVVRSLTREREIFRVAAGTRSVGTVDHE